MWFSDRDWCACRNYSPFLRVTEAFPVSLFAGVCPALSLAVHVGCSGSERGVICYRVRSYFPGFGMFITCIIVICGLMPLMSCAARLRLLYTTTCGTYLLYICHIMTICGLLSLVTHYYHVCIVIMCDRTRITGCI